MKSINEITEEFFKRRFPDKNIQFEKDCGYFWEWAERFKSKTKHKILWVFFFGEKEKVMKNFLL